MSDHEVAPENPQNPNPDWECNDIPVGMLIKSAIGTFAVVIVAFVGMIGVFKYYNASIDAQSEGIPEWATERVLPEGDNLLQATPVADLNEYENNENELLNSYGWADAKAKVARIPIADAKAHMLKEVFKTSVEKQDDHAGHDHAAAHGDDHAEKPAPAQAHRPHGHPDHDHAKHHAPVKAEKVDAHGAADHSEHAH